MPEYDKAAFPKHPEEEATNRKNKTKSNDSRKTAVSSPTEVIKLLKLTFKYEGDPRSNSNTSVISSTFGISKNGLHVYYDILSIL